MVRFVLLWPLGKGVGGGLKTEGCEGDVERKKDRKSHNCAQKNKTKE